MSTFCSAQSDAAAVGDLRAWSEEQLIAAAKSGRRAPFGELCQPGRGEILAGCEADSIKLENCPAYIRVRIERVKVEQVPTNSVKGFEV